MDIENLRVDELSDAQIEQLLKKANSMGYAESDIYVLAQSRGVDAGEIQKLRSRITSLRQSQSDAPPSSDKKADKSAIRKMNILPSSKLPLKRFGESIFDSATNLSFESSLLLPTPETYKIGPGDEMQITIYGLSEFQYRETVNSQGNLVLPNVGVVPVSGLKLQIARKRIMSKLSSIYQDLSSEKPQTFLDIEISKIRSIKVSIVGEIKRPGTYTVNGLSSIYNAIYLAGGPNANGSLREIQLFRNNKLIERIDYYDFLIKGESKNQLRMEDDDIILIRPYQNLVSIEGQVKREGVYEMLEGETLEDLLNYSGGFDEEAYSSRVKLYRNTSKEKLIADVYDDQFALFETKGGDRYEIGKILNRYRNRVVIKGAVYRPGSYALFEGMTIRSLIQKADGLTGDAFLKRAVLTRSNEDFSTEKIDLHLGSLLNGTIEDIQVKREDVLEILSIYDVTDEAYVKISGEVNAGGTFPYSSGMTIQDLIFMADGFTRSANQTSAEVSRLAQDQNENKIAEVLQIEIPDGLSSSPNDSETILEPYDQVFVRRNPNFFSPKNVMVAGEVNYPGEYTLKGEYDRVSDIVKRAGGLKNLAYIDGTTILRKTEFQRSDNTTISRKASLEGLLLSFDTAFLTEADARQIEGIYNELENTYIFPEKDEQNLATQAKRQRLIDLAKANPFLNGLQNEETESIAVDLEEAIRKPGSTADLILEEGDIISIPRKQETMRVRGRVLYPNTVKYEESKPLPYYIEKAGGFNSRAKRGSTYVVYANGEVSRTKHFLFFRNYPKAAPGAEVIVPVKPLKVPLKPGEIIGLTSGLATLAVLVTQLIQLNQN